MFNVGDKIVYPMHGAGTIDSIEEKDILGEKQSYYILKMPSDVKVMIPTAKAEEVGVRNIIDKQSAEKVFKVLSQDETEMEKNWNKRYRDKWIVTSSPTCIRLTSVTVRPSASATWENP